MSKFVSEVEKIQNERAEEPDSSSSPSKVGVFLWICLSITATIFSYQLGLQQGMEAAKTESPKQWLYYYDDNFEEHAVTLSQAAEATRQAAPPVTSAASPVPEKKTAPFPNKSGYTIQVVTYRSKTLSQKEVERLNQKGHKAFVIASGEFYQVCVDFFESQKLATQKLIQLRREKYYETYPGAFVKFVKR